MQHVWTIVCQKSIIDSETNNISLLEAVEQLNLVKKKSDDAPPKNVLTSGITSASIPFRIEVVTLWSRDTPDSPERSLSRVVILSPSGKELYKAEQDVDLMKHARSRNRSVIFGFPVAAGEEGIYRFVVELFDAEKEDFASVASVPVQASIAGE